MAGHSKWANIKHKKARTDAKRGKMWSKCARAIIVAAKNGGGNPETHLTLRYAIDDAKAVNMPKDTIENAIKKGAGELGGKNYESFIYEGYAPGGVALMLDILTDNRNRTAGEVRKIFEKSGGNLGASGCVSYLFQPRGQIFINNANTDEETVMTAALEAGADDVIDEGEVWQILCNPTTFAPLREALEQVGLEVEAAQIAMVPETTISCSGREAKKVIRLVDALEDHDDVQKVHANFEIPDDELAALQG